MDEIDLTVLEGLLFAALIAAVVWLAAVRSWRRPSSKVLSPTCSIISKSSLVAADGRGQSELGALIELEFERARRFDYCVSVAVVELSGIDATEEQLARALRGIADSTRQVPAHDSPPGTVSIFRGRADMAITLRATDLAILDKERNRFVMLLVGSAKADALRISDRIRKQLVTAFGGAAQVGCAVFPDDGYFVNDLILGAEKEIAAGVVALPDAALVTNERA